jgi:predicted flavoprotein YhiN
LKADKYNSDFVKPIIEHNGEVFNLLKETGFMYYHDEEGRYYPISESSLTLINVFNDLLKKYKVNVVTSKEVKDIKYQDKIFIDDEIFDRVVLSIGNISYQNDKINYNRLIKTLPLEITALTPSLAPISTTSFPSELENKRIKCEVSLIKNNKVLKKERGEVLFKKNGLSGIVIFNMACYLSRLHLKDYIGYEISLNLLPDLSKDQTKNLIANHINLHNILIDSLANYIDKSLDPVDMLSDMRFGVKGIYDFASSQVTSGGIALKEINPDLSLKINPHIYVGGEEIDIDGECGGYNIAFALNCGYHIGKNLK